MRSGPDEPWQWAQIPEGSPAETALTLLMLRGALDGDGRPTDLVDLASRRTAHQHLEPCPPCRHRAEPGPRAYGLWCTEPWLAAE